jgi:hypothetical protein
VSGGIARTRESIARFDPSALLPDSTEAIAADESRQEAKLMEHREIIG